MRPELYETPVHPKSGHCPTCGVKLDAKCHNEYCLEIHGKRSDPLQTSCDHCLRVPREILNFSETTRIM